MDGRKAACRPRLSSLVASPHHAGGELGGNPSSSRVSWGVPLSQVSVRSQAVDIFIFLFSILRTLGETTRFPSFGGRSGMSKPILKRAGVVRGAGAPGGDGRTGHGRKRCCQTCVLCKDKRLTLSITTCE